MLVYRRVMLPTVNADAPEYLVDRWNCGRPHGSTPSVIVFVLESRKQQGNSTVDFSGLQVVTTIAVDGDAKLV